MRNFTEMGYETITVIRSEYPPQIGKCLSISPVLWIQTSEKEDGSKQEKRYFVFAKNNCIKQIYEIGKALNDYIDGIITRCGNILPINNKIEFLESEGIGLECVEGKLKFVIKAPLDTSLGGTGFVTYNDGDILVGNQDGKLSILLKGEIGQVLGVKPDGTIGYINAINKLTCDATAITENSFTRWNKDGMCLKNSKSIQDEDGNIKTINSIDEILDYTTKNENGSATHTIESENQNAGLYLKTNANGYPYIHLIQGDQTWDIRCNPTNKALEFRPVADLMKPSMLTLFPNGNCVRSYQPKASAYLTTTGPFEVNKQYPLGSTKPFIVIRDDDGYNKNVGNFFPGGNGQGAYYTTPYSGRFYEISYQFVVDLLGVSAGVTEFFLEISYGDFVLFNRYFIPNGSTYQSAVGGGNLPESVAGQKIKFHITVKLRAQIISFVKFPNIDNYIQIYMKD